MKIQNLILATIILSASCQNAEKKQSTVSNGDSVIKAVVKEEVLLEPRLVTASKQVNQIEDLIGYWVGDFLPIPKDSFYEQSPDYWNSINKINISIDSIKDDTVIGHSVVAGNRRPFKGKIEKNESAFHIQAVEPGDDKYDGKFDFSIPISGKELSGTWKSFITTIKTPERKYSLSKTHFKYNPEVEMENQYINTAKSKKTKYTYEDEEYTEEIYSSSTSAIYRLNASTKLLSKKQVENLKKGDIIVLRNSIYAKHGFSFKKKSLRNYFDAQAWYIPILTDIRNNLTNIEKANIKLLLSYEEHAKEYYDSFGR